MGTEGRKCTRLTRLQKHDEHRFDVKKRRNDLAQEVMSAHVNKRIIQQLQITSVVIITTQFKSASSTRPLDKAFMF